MCSFRPEGEIGTDIVLPPYPSGSGVGVGWPGCTAPPSICRRRSAANAFLDGTSSGEQRMGELLDVMTASGVAAVNIIPDRNWNIADPETRALKVRNLGEFIGQAKERDLPILVGTEMNAHGQKRVDDFDALELAPFYDVFQEGMYILHAHTVLQRHGGMGYLSAWAKDAFTTTGEKNAFFREFGKRAAPDAALNLEGAATPEELLARTAG